MHMLKQLRPALVLFILMSAIIGLVYPLAVTGMAQLLFSHQANGSLIVQDGKTRGSSLIGQPFSGAGLCRLELGPHESGVAG
jgi:K+-transporting ATPase ATPase C chain